MAVGVDGHKIVSEACCQIHFVLMEGQTSHAPDALPQETVMVSDQTKLVLLLETPSSQSAFCGASKHNNSSDTTISHEKYIAYLDSMSGT